ncbi:MAG: hypothetical protein IPK19_41345 [Chloroflexi bacterium]|nr:hypothetical protein [Chloroflexota bacterium]
MTGMVGVPFGLDDLRACLESVAPVELKGMRLLEAQPHLIAGTARIPRADLVEAVTEIVAYTGRCAAAARQLASLPPVPLLTVSIPEFGL